MIRSYRERPVEISAIRYMVDNREECIRFSGAKHTVFNTPGDFSETEALLIDTSEGTMRANVGDWIVCGVKGEFYPCKHDIFEATYIETIR